MDTKGARELEDRIRDLEEDTYISLYNSGLPYMRIYRTEKGYRLMAVGLIVRFYNVSRTDGTIDLYRGSARVATIYTDALEMVE